MVQVAFYAIWPGNGLGPFYIGPGTHTGLCYSLVKHYVAQKTSSTFHLSIHTNSKLSIHLRIGFEEFLCKIFVT